MDVNGRGIPTHCRCGECVRLLTSRTVKNPGRLFHSCPYGDEVMLLAMYFVELVVLSGNWFELT